MRRPPIACHRAVQSLQHAAPQHVWISDELLSSAVNQFFRISHPHQKRYGSHVPGPLEAKRRAAKRKMSISAGFYPQDNFPPPFSLSSLFGFAKQSLPTWRYEPPSLPRKADSLSNSPAEADTAYHPQPQVSADPTISEHDDTQSYTAHSLNAEKEVVEHKESGEVIGLCIDAFKAQLPDVGALTAAKRAQLLATAFEACRPSHPNPWEYNLAVIEYLAQQPWGSFSLVNKIWSFAIPPTFSADTVRLLDSISRLAVAWPKRRAGFANLYCKIVDEYTHGKTLTGSLKNIHDKDLLKMIRQLWHLAPARSANVEQFMLDTLSAIAENVQDKHLRRPLLSILSSLHALEHRIMLLIVRASEKAVLRSAATQVLECLPRALLRTSLKPLTQRLVNNMRRSKGMERTGQRHRYMTWLSMLDELDHSSSVSEADMTLIDEAISSVQAPMSVPKRSLQKWVEEELELLLLQASIGDLEFLSVRGKMMQILDLAGSSGGHDDDTLTPPQFVATVFAQMQQASLPYHDLLKQFMTASSDNLPATFTLEFLTALQDRNVVIHDISAMDTFYSKKAAKLLDVKACSSRREREHFAYDLHICQRIVDVLSRFSSTHVAHNYAGLKTHLNQLHARYQFEHILERAQAGRALPLAYRQIEATAAHEERVALVHQLAYTYAHDTTMSQREAWRAIYYLYRYLQQNELPIGSLFTRAVVHSCISRPMNERRFVSVSRVAWVCRLVAEVEGKKEAERIEYLFWQWRGDIIKHAITVHERAGGSRNEKTYIGTMKRLDLM